MFVESVFVESVLWIVRTEPAAGLTCPDVFGEMEQRLSAAQPLGQKGVWQTCLRYSVGRPST